MTGQLEPGGIGAVGCAGVIIVRMKIDDVMWYLCGEGKKENNLCNETGTNYLVVTFQEPYS